MNMDFLDFCKNIKKDDFIYFDPPYYPIKKTSFVSYQKDGFDKMHEQLFYLCTNLKNKNIKFIQ